jgi:hypothetical protein
MLSFSLMALISFSSIALLSFSQIVLLSFGRDGLQTQCTIKKPYQWQAEFQPDPIGEF